MGFWSSRRVMVTGGAGFLGSVVTEKLRDRGAASVSVPRSAEFDLTKGDDARRAFSHFRPDLVLHLAARVGGIGESQAHPAQFFYENLMLGVQLMHEAWLAGVEKLVTIGSACSYPEHAPMPLNEADMWDGYPEETNAPYGLAKRMLLVGSRTYREEHGFNSVNVILANLYGPGDNADPETSHVVSALIRKCLEAVGSGADEIELWGDGSPTREFLYVDDAAEGILMAAERYDSSDPVNLGSGHEISIRDLAATIADLTGFKGRVTWDTSRPNGQPNRRLDTRRALAEFGFESRVPLSAGLKTTIASLRTVLFSDANRHRGTV